MTTRSPNQRVWRYRPYMLFLVLVVFVIPFLSGCKQKKEQPKEPPPSITLENLQTAYTKALRHHFMYVKFVAGMEKQKNMEMAAMYRAIARSEQIHADQHAALLRSKNTEPKEPQYDSVTVGNALQTLKMAISSEEIEVESMYPNLARSAEAENFTTAAEQFRNCGDGDARQLELLKDAQQKNGKVRKIDYTVCPNCGYIFTTEETQECPTCKTTKDKFEKI